MVEAKIQKLFNKCREAPRSIRIRHAGNQRMHLGASLQPVEKEHKTIVKSEVNAAQSSKNDFICIVDNANSITRGIPLNRMAKLVVKETTIRTLAKNGIDYICITDIGRQKNSNEPKDVVKNWMRVKNTLEYLGLWESLNNPDFNGVEFDPILRDAGSNSFTRSRKW